MNKLKVLYKSFRQIVFNKTLIRTVFLLFLWKAVVLERYVRPSATLTFCIILYSLLWSKAMSRARLTLRWLVGLVFLEVFLIPLYGLDNFTWDNFLFFQYFVFDYVISSLLFLNLDLCAPDNQLYDWRDYQELKKKRDQMRESLEQMVLK